MDGRFTTGLGGRSAALVHSAHITKCRKTEAHNASDNVLVDMPITTVTKNRLTSFNQNIRSEDDYGETRQRWKLKRVGDGHSGMARTGSRPRRTGESFKGASRWDGHHLDVYHRGLHRRSHIFAAGHKRGVALKPLRALRHRDGACLPRCEDKRLRPERAAAASAV